MIKIIMVLCGLSLGSGVIFKIIDTILQEISFRYRRPELNKTTIKNKKKIVKKWIKKFIKRHSNAYYKSNVMIEAKTHDILVYKNKLCVIHVDGYLLPLQCGSTASHWNHGEKVKIENPIGRFKREKVENKVLDIEGVKVQIIACYPTIRRHITGDGVVKKYKAFEERICRKVDDDFKNNKQLVEKVKGGLK